MNDEELNIAEIPYESGNIRFRYSRYLSPSKDKWIKHGLFRAYFPNGNLASEGTYENGRENGHWQDFHENGKTASEGEYKNGAKIGIWKFWNSNGEFENEENYPI